MILTAALSLALSPSFGYQFIWTTVTPSGYSHNTQSRALKSNKSINIVSIDWSPGGTNSPLGEPRILHFLRSIFIQFLPDQSNPLLTGLFFPTVFLFHFLGDVLLLCLPTLNVYNIRR